MPDPGTDDAVLDGPSGLPVEVTSFVGRRAERAELRALFATNRLVTLTGFGGVGKTRLALRTASDMRRAFKAGVVFVPLATQTEAGLVANSVADALGLEGRSNRSAIAAVVDYLRPRHALLVLDNCEHLVDATAQVVDTLLRTCPDLRVLATSREPLRIDGEAVHPVLPLSLPTPSGAEPLQQSEAATLFFERARSLVGELEQTEETQRAVAAVVSRLEGIPLAIELAAGRLRSMSPLELQQNLTERWDLLTRGSRNAPQRQRTMAACIEWSFDLCTPAEQRLWARLAIFADGFELDAVREVCRPVPQEHHDEPVDDVLAALVDKSIVIPVAARGRTRFRMLPPIRHRGLAHLRERNELDELRRRHRDWYVDLTRRTAQHWLSAEQVEYMNRLRRESGNLRVALEACVGTPEDSRQGLVIGASLLTFGLADGLFRDGRLWFDRLLPGDTEPTAVRARALRTASCFAAMQGDLERAACLLEEGRGIAEQLGGAVEVELTTASAFLAMFRGDHDLARTLLDTAVAGCVVHGDESEEAFAHALSALANTLRGDVEAALESHHRCLAITEPRGEFWYRAYSTWIAGLALWASGRAEESVALQRESLRLKRRTRDQLGIALSIAALAWAEAEQDPARAARMLGAAQGIWDRIETSTTALPSLHALQEGPEARMRELLGREQYETEHAAGRRLAPMGAIDLALGEPATPAATPPQRTSGRRAAQSGALTPRERQVAGLVATGMSNKDIAATLVISKRTAETHVDHILTKLGFNSRNQISAWVREHPAGPA